MLGVSIVSFSTPASLGYAIRTFRSGAAGPSRIIALCLAILFAAPIALGLIVAMVAMFAQALS